MALDDREVVSGREVKGSAFAPGRVVQVDPLRPKLKPPGTKRLKLEYEGLLSIFGFKFNLRRYHPAAAAPACCSSRTVRPTAGATAWLAAACCWFG
jgi:hypothetical protein